MFIHSRGGAGVPLNGGSITSGASAAGQRIRTDLKVPVFMFETETDVAELFASARQPDTPIIRNVLAADRGELLQRARQVQIAAG